MKKTTKQKTPKVKSNSNGTLSNCQREMLRLDDDIIQQNAAVQEAEVNLQDAETARKEAKQEYNTQIKLLRGLIGRLVETQAGQGHLDFDAGMSAPETTARWRDVLQGTAEIRLADIYLMDCNCPPNIDAADIEALAGLQVETVGDFETMALAERWWESIDGIDEERAAAITETIAECRRRYGR